MTKRTKMSLWLVLPVLALSLGAITFATAKILRHTPAEPDTAQNSSKVTKPDRRIYVRRNLLAPRLALNLNALGNRLEQPGRERLIMMGNWRLTDSAKTLEFAAFLEFPDRLRLSLSVLRKTVPSSSTDSRRKLC